MGMPFSNYALFQSLSGGRDGFTEKFFPAHQVRKVLDKYNLYAFIIHDPLTHPEFDKILNETFEELDRISGGKLIFFTLVNPSNQWKSIAKEREYFREFYRYEYIQSKDSSFTAHSLAHMLSIPEEDLPCIFVTNDFRNKDFRYFKADSTNIVTQMKELGEFAFNTPEVKFDLNYIDNKLNSGTINIQDGRVEFDNSIAKLFANLLTFIGAGLSFQNRTENNWRNILSKKKEFLGILKSRGDDSKVEQFSLHLNNLVAELHRPSASYVTSNETPEKGILYDKSANYIDLRDVGEVDYAQLGSIKKIEPNITEILTTCKHYFEPDTIRYFKGAIASYNLFKRSRDDYDYSSVTLGLSKGFENEINFSAVQWVRKEKGVEMPQFFNKIKPDFQVKILPNLTHPIPIDFNNGRGQKLFYPELGKSYLGTKTITETKFPDVWEQKNKFDDFMSLWNEIARNRNRAAHPEPISLNDANRIIRYFCEIATNGWFNKMFQLKNECRGNIAHEH